MSAVPGLTVISVVPRIWAAAGLPLPELLSTMVETALAGVSRSSRQR
ncbi:hypothetical protein ACFFMR_04785 [Micromonospora andamanensis]|nr:hypothetical protein [Micromonospora andamanensis]